MNSLKVYISCTEVKPNVIFFFLLRIISNLVFKLGIHLPEDAQKSLTELPKHAKKDLSLKCI